ncbi:hypothetical protein [Desulfovibrio sp.]|uniref:hypothetical protein n=1 Tax=Desulfovibrio sp. TaxID=885 RepID=UPI00344E1EDC
MNVKWTALSTFIERSIPIKTHILGFPSIGRQRELKQALESFWNGSRSATSYQKLQTVHHGIRVSTLYLRTPYLHMIWFFRPSQP